MEDFDSMYNSIIKKISIMKQDITEKVKERETAISRSKSRISKRERSSSFEPKGVLKPRRGVKVGQDYNPRASSRCSKESENFKNLKDKFKCIISDFDKKPKNNHSEGSSSSIYNLSSEKNSRNSKSKNSEKETTQNDFTIEFLTPG